MGVQQAGDLHGRVLAAPRRTWNQRHLGDVWCHRDSHAAQELNAFGDRVDELILLAIVFVEQQMQLIERRPGQPASGASCTGHAM